jgi:HD-like signal output (HDOD) protein
MLELFRRLLKSSKSPLDSLLAGFELPTFPSTVMSVLSRLRDPESSLEEIAAQIEMDPGIHVKILKTVNSAAFGLSRQVADLPRAIVLLGRSRLESLILSVVVKDALPIQGTSDFNQKRFWLTAARRATLARIFASHLHPATQAESFTAGLLQDVAVPVLMSAKGDDYAAVYNRWVTDPSTSLSQLEQESLDQDHAVVGAAMAAEWKLPTKLVEAIASHTDPVVGRTPDVAIKMVSLIRDDLDAPGTDKLAEVCVDKLEMPAPLVEEIFETGFRDADEFSRMMS